MIDCALSREVSQPLENQANDFRGLPGSFLLRSYFYGWVGRVGAAGPGVLPPGTPPPNVAPDLPD